MRKQEIVSWASNEVLAWAPAPQGLSALFSGGAAGHVWYGASFFESGVPMALFREQARQPEHPGTPGTGEKMRAGDTRGGVCDGRIPMPKRRRGSAMPGHSRAPEFSLRRGLYPV